MRILSSQRMEFDFVSGQVDIGADEAVAPPGTQLERVQETVQRCADNFAKGIAKHPEDWHMLQRIWVDADFKERVDA